LTKAILITRKPLNLKILSYSWVDIVEKNSHMMEKINSLLG